MRKWMVLVLAVVLLAGMAACNPGGKADGESGPPAQASQEAAEDGASQDAVGGGEEEGQSAPQEAPQEPGSTFTVGGVTYTLGDKVGKLFDNGWYLDDGYNPGYGGGEMLARDLEEPYGSLVIRHDDVDFLMGVGFNTYSLEADDPVGEALIGALSAQFDQYSTTPWNIAGMVDNTSTWDAVLQEFPDAETEAYSGYGNIHLGDYLPQRDRYVWLDWDMDDEYFSEVSVHFNYMLQK